jgi:hypothetical protein
MGVWAHGGVVLGLKISRQARASGHPISMALCPHLDRAEREENVLVGLAY